MFRYIRGASGIVLVFDITNLKSFQDLERILREVKQHSTDAPIILVGCKLGWKEMRRILIEMFFKPYFGI